MPLIKYISERIYEVFRIDGLKNNSQVTETLTVATTPDDSFIEIPAGRVGGKKSVNKFGRSTNVDSGIPTDVHDGANATDDVATWLAPVSPVIHKIKSTDASDTALSLSGANQIQVYGIGSWDAKEISEVILLDGANDVDTVNQYAVIHRMKGGLTGVNAIVANLGVITATTDDIAANVTAQINIGQGQTQMAIYGIPSVQAFYVTKFYASILRANLGTTESHADIQLLFNPSGNLSVGGMWLVKHSTSVGTRAAPLQHDFMPYNRFAGPGILKIEATGSANNLDVSAGFDGILVDN